MFEFRNLGVHTSHLLNVFPTKTFTNHFSIATGLYPETHGVLSNELFDLKLQKDFGYSYELFHYNDDVIPIWVRSFVTYI